MLTLKSVSMRYGQTTALQDVSLEIAPGEFFGLLGPNGAGKSTLMSLVAGLRAPSAGDILFDGTPLTRSNAHVRGQVGLVPQSIALYDDLSAETNLRLFGGLHGLRGKELRSRIDEALEAVQLTDRRRDLVNTFSGGMQRRLNIAASLLHRPKLLLCDEPTVGVDPQSRNAIFEQLRQLNREGLTVVYSTHYMEEAEKLCTRIGVIDHGRILKTGTLEDLLSTLPFEEEITFPGDGRFDALAEDLRPLGELTKLEGVHRFRPRPGTPLSQCLLRAEQRGFHGRAFTFQRPNLEAVFLSLTGRTLRD